MSLPDAVPVHRDDELASEREREDRGPSIIKIGWASPVACKNVLPSASNLFGNVLFRDRSRIRVNGGSWPLSVSATEGCRIGPVPLSWRILNSWNEVAAWPTPRDSNDSLTMFRFGCHFRRRVAGGSAWARPVLDGRAGDNQFQLHHHHHSLLAPRVLYTGTLYVSHPRPG
jgi:hypothetical protein